MEKPCGTCDICETNLAERWYGRTNSATCYNAECLIKMDERYAESCAELDRERLLEQEMREEYGGEY